MKKLSLWCSLDEFGIAGQHATSTTMSTIFDKVSEEDCFREELDWFYDLTSSFMRTKITMGWLPSSYLAKLR